MDQFPFEAFTARFRGQDIKFTMAKIGSNLYLSFKYPIITQWTIQVRSDDKPREEANQRGLYQIEKNKPAPANFNEVLCKDVAARFDALINKFGLDTLKNNPYANLTPSNRWTPYTFLLDEIIFDFLSGKNEVFI